MRLEKLSENQIKCILDKDDLTSRGIRISELAYGSEKTRELFSDMMQQANCEFGFDAEDSPLMIEAIPALDRLVLVITKVENPDEIDSRFSRFSPDPIGDYFGDDEEEELGELDEMESTPSPAFDDDFIPLAKSLGVDIENKEDEKETEQEPAENKQAIVFSFGSLSEVCSAVSRIAERYDGPSSVFKDASKGRYYLMIIKVGQSTEEFGKIIRLLTEFGNLERTTYATKPYMEEHYETIVKENAIGILKDM